MIPQSAIPARPAGGRKPQSEEMIRFVQGAFALPATIPLNISLLEGRGSDRTFYRLTWNYTHSAILIHYDPMRVENTYYADIALFLNEVGVPVPKLIRHDSTNHLILMEDLGDIDLWSLRETPWETRRTLYQKTLSVIHKLHSFPEKEFPKERLRLMESFSLDLYRWEWNYFKEHLIRGICQIELEPSFEANLEEELSALAKRLLGTKRCLIHRDFQSQNVMIRNDKPFLIDFQGMRWGTPFYDLGSLLYDPYVELNESQRLDLLAYYYNLSRQELVWEDFLKIFREASSQRLMQALGAYGFLGLQKNLKSFLSHIPAGIRNLNLATSHLVSLPHLHQLSEKCQRAINHRGEQF